MAKGELKCVGTAQHLKLKYGKGYVLTVNLMPPTGTASAGGPHSNPRNNPGDDESDFDNRISSGAASVDENCDATDAAAAAGDALKRFVVNELGHGHAGTALISSVNRTRKFLIHKSSDTTISEIFRLMEQNKSLFRIREWGLSMSTLEDAFISVVEKAEEQHQQGEWGLEWEGAIGHVC